MKGRNNRGDCIHIHATITMLKATAEGDNTLTYDSNTEEDPHTEPGPGFLLSFFFALSNSSSKDILLICQKLKPSLKQMAFKLLCRLLAIS